MCTVREYQHGDRKDDQAARGIQPHHQVTAVFAVDQHAGKWQQDERGQRLPAINVPRETSECVACRMNQMTAAEFIPLPIMETRFAMKISLIPRCCHISRILCSL